MKHLFFILFSFLLGVSQAQTLQFSGKVYVDANDNGIRDPGEKNLKRIQISNGTDLVETDRKGKYTISATPGTNIFPVLPSGYTFSKKNTWWFPVKGEGNSPEEVRQVDFGLLPASSGKNFKVLVIGDIQVGDSTELDYADRSILSELRAREDYDLSLFLGDLVNDEPELFPPLKKLMGNLQKPSWAVYGNHDRNSDRSHQDQHLDFSQYFGPTTYAFHRDKVLFVVLNSIEPVGKYGYDGRYAASDLAFLEALLKNRDSDQLLVVSQHIPLGWMENKEAMLELLKQQDKVLLLSGHTHTVFQNFRKREQGGEIHELTAGAVSGHWWTGQKDWQGIPLALMQCGTPRGYFEIEFSRKKDYTDYRIHYKGVGMPAEEQLSLWFGETGNEISRRLSPENSDILANIYAGSEKTEVKMRVDGGAWEPMERTRMIDPFINRIKNLQKEKRSPDGMSKRSPYLSRTSSHIWKATVSPELEEGYHELEIVAKDELGLEHREIAWFWFGK